MPVKGTIDLSDEESRLISYVLEAESFRTTAWEKYGTEWTDHIPQAINAFCKHYFDTKLPTWVLAVYYSPQPEITVHGARGAAKTVSIALAMAIYHTLHPGEPWLHVSPVKDQAARTYEAIMLWGNRPLDHPNWYERFVDSCVTAPFHEIRLKSWDPTDPGNIFRFRPLADVEYLRSMEAGTITVDEGFRDVPDPDIYPQLRGCIRGTNQVKKTMLPQIIQNEIDGLIDEKATAESATAKKIERKLEKLYIRHGLLRRGLFCLYGNVAGWDWEWERYERAESDPQHYFSLTVTTYDNPYLDRHSISDMERTYGDNSTLRDTEMLAKRPLNIGGMFVSIEYNIDRTLLPPPEGVIVESKTPFGIFHYACPPDNTHFYVIGADPGAGVAPGRNKWVILAYDMATRPIRLAYFRMGHINTRAKGDITEFWDELKRVTAIYPHYPSDVWVESTANQKGQVQLAMPEDVSITPVSFSTTKPAMINQLRMLFDRRMFALPPIPVILREHGNYELPDKDLTQDIVMANICAAGAMWRYIDLDYDLKNTESPYERERKNAVPTMANGRYSRPTGVREHRVPYPVVDVVLQQPPSIWVTSSTNNIYVVSAEI